MTAEEYFQGFFPVIEPYVYDASFVKLPHTLFALPWALAGAGSFVLAAVLYFFAAAVADRVLQRDLGDDEPALQTAASGRVGSGPRAVLQAVADVRRRRV